MVALQEKHARNSPRAKVNASNAPAEAEAQTPLQQKSRSSILEKQEKGSEQPPPQQQARNSFVEKQEKECEQPPLQQRAAPQFHIRSDDCVELQSAFAYRWFSKCNCFPNSRVRHADESQCCQSERFEHSERFSQMPARCDSEGFLRVEKSPGERFRHAMKSLSSFFDLSRCHPHGFRMVMKLWSIL